MRRRYAAAGFLAQDAARAGRLVDGLNLTTDVIVGHPAEAGRRLRAHARRGQRRPASPRCTCSRTRRGRARPTPADDPVPLAEKRRRSRRAAARCPTRQGARSPARPRWDGASGCWWRTPTARGYSDDYTPFRVDRRRPRPAGGGAGRARGRRRRDRYPVLVTLTERIQAELREAMKSGDRAAGGRAAAALLVPAEGREGRARASSGTSDARPCCGVSASSGSRRPRPTTRPGQDDRAARERADLPVIDEFLPAALSEQRAGGAGGRGDRRAPAPSR